MLETGPSGGDVGGDAPTRRRRRRRREGLGLSAASLACLAVWAVVVCLVWIVGTAVTSLVAP